MTDHYLTAEDCLRRGRILRAVAHALLALVDEFRRDTCEPMPPLHLPGCDQ